MQEDGKRNIALLDEGGNETIHLDGGDADLTAGGEGHDLGIRMLNAAGGGDLSHPDAGTAEIFGAR